MSSGTNSNAGIGNSSPRFILSFSIRYPLREIVPTFSLAGFPPPEIMLARIEAILRFDRRAELTRIAAPTLVVGAEDDAVTPAYFSEELGRLIPGAATELLAGGGHFFPVTAAEEFRRLLLDFLERPARAAEAAR